MNKETIYIEPSDDITDILSKLKASEKKVVAIVPPKKPAVLLSSVNIKLISRVAKQEKKAVVLVTTDDSLTKLAMAANLPVAPSLKSRPVLPGEAPTEEAKPAQAAALTEPKAEPEDSTESEEPEEHDSEGDAEPEETDAGEEEDESSDSEETEQAEEEGDTDSAEDSAEESEKEEDKDEDEDVEDDKKSKKSKKKSKKAEKEYSNPVIGFIATHKLWVIGGSVLLVGIIVFLFWALTIAPRVSVAVAVRTTSSNFSENVTFSTKAESEDSSAGVFYLHEEKTEKEQTVKFTATGKKDLGEQAAGSLVVYANLFGAMDGGQTISIPEGTTFFYNSLEYTAISSATLSWDGNATGTCENVNEVSGLNEWKNIGCRKSARVSIKATAPGEDYNISGGQDSGWTSGIRGVNAYSDADVSGGTSRIVTVVQQSDVDLALNKLASESSDSAKSEIYAKLSETVMPIDASFKVTTTDPAVTPAVGEEVKEGVTPQVATKTTYVVYSVDRVRIEEFIGKKAAVEEGKRMYSVGDPFIEYFTETSDGSTFTAKLKTTYKTGPEISETEVLEKIRGEKIGRVEPVLKDAFTGIASVKIEKSYFWVSSIPSDENKITIKLEVEE